MIKIGIFIALLSGITLFSDGQQSTGKLAQINTYKKGVAVCVYSDASQAGISILKKGGNAADAAVAVQFALAVTFPEAGNIGGGGFCVLRKSNGTIAALDFREKAPSAAFANMFLDRAGNVVPNMSLATHSAFGVPGSVDGMIEGHKRYGKVE